MHSSISFCSLLSLLGLSNLEACSIRFLKLIRISFLIDVPEQHHVRVQGNCDEDCGHADIHVSLNEQCFVA